MIAFGQEHNYGKVPADKILFYKSSNMRDLKNYRIKVTPISSSLTEKIYVHLEPLCLFFVLFGINKCPQFMILSKHLNGKFERMCPPHATSWAYSCSSMFTKAAEFIENKKLPKMLQWLSSSPNCTFWVRCWWGRLTNLISALIVVWIHPSSMWYQFNLLRLRAHSIWMGR